MFVPLFLLVGANAFDYVTFLVMAARHGLSAEANPIVVRIAQELGLPGLTVAKLAVVSIAALTAIVIGPQRPRTAMLVLVAGIGVGALGGMSNIASI